MKVVRTLIIFTVGLAMVSLLGCTESQVSRNFRWNEKSTVICYSGGVPVYQGVSTGAVESEPKSDGFFFREDGTGDLITVSGTCIQRSSD